MSDRVRIGSVGYLNAQPLIQELDREVYEVVEACPSAIAAQLEAGEVDVALVPIVAALSDPSWRVVPGVCIGAEGPVASVLWVGETPPESWTSLVLDGESRTSAILSRVLLKGPMRESMKDVQVVDGEPGCGIERARGATGALVIGDAAMSLPERLTHRVDLAEAWFEWTGYPFVFAVWAGRPDLPPQVAADLRGAAAAGLEGRRDRYQGEELAYLTESIRYELDERAHIGMRRFASLAASSGWVPCSEVQLYGPATPRVHRVNVDTLLQRAADQELLEGPELIRLGVEARLNDLGAAAHLKREALHPRDRVSWRLGLRVDGLPADEPELLAKAVALGVTDVAWSEASTRRQLAEVSSRFPGLRGHAPWARVDVREEWVASGLQVVSVDEGGIWCPRVRAQNGVSSCTEEALEQELTAAMDSGLEVEATLGVGQGETLEERVAHLLALRRVAADHGALALRVWAALCPGLPAGSSANTADDLLRMTALARIALPSGSLRASPETEGLGVAQTALRMGCDSLGVIWLSDAPAFWPREIEQVGYHLVTAGYGAGNDPVHAASSPPKRGPYRRTLVDST